MMNKFIIATENFVAKMIAVKALKAVDDNAVAHNLYKKACMNGGKIVISTLDEMKTWRDALKNYKPANTTEGKVYRVLTGRAVRGYEKRVNEALATAPSAV